MNIYDIVNTRRSTRDYLEKDVPIATIKRVLNYALRTPSGGNLQPWHIHVVSGNSLAKLKAKMKNQILTQTKAQAETPEYDIYPSNLKSPYRERHSQVGEALYGKLNILREDKLARHQWFLRNFEFFGAPVGLFFSIDRTMGAAQWSDLGMLMQTVMLLLKEEGLDSCAQECWSLYPKTLGEFLALPQAHMLFAGMAVGYGNHDNPVNQLRTERASPENVIQYML